MKEAMKAMYQQETFVVVPDRTQNLFYMNMKVFRVERSDRIGGRVPLDGRIIWCAVYQPSAQPLPS